MVRSGGGGGGCVPFRQVNEIRIVAFLFPINQSVRPLTITESWRSGLA